MRCADLDDARFMELFELAASLPAAERRSRLVDACEGDAELVGELLQYVERHDRMGNFLLHPFAPLTDRAMRFTPGQLVSGRFRIAREVGEGGMAIVYEAFDEKLEHRCALKCPKAGFGLRLPAEARAALAITHDNVCRVYGIYTAESAAGPIDVLAMEYLDGPTLKERLRDGPLADGEARAIARQLCAGIGAAHRKEVLHRDLKSNNIMLAASAGGEPRAVITDFGLAGRLTEDGSAGSHMMAGTLPYMAPELLKGEPATKSSDLYALGVVLYEMVTGALPRRGNAPGHALVPPSRLMRGLDRRWDRVTARCLEERTRDVAEVDGILRTGPIRRAAPVAAVIAIVTSMVGVLIARAPGPPRIKLALLPLTAAAGDEALAGIGGGVTYDLADRLRRLEARDRSLFVIPPSEAVRFRVTAPEQARTKLSATHVLSGTIMRIGDTLRVRGSLVDARTLLPVRELAALYTLDRLSDAAMALAGTVTVGLNLAGLADDHPMDPDAYRLFVEGVGHLRAGLAHADRAIQLLEQAIAADPSSARPHAALAEAYVSKYDSRPTRDWLDRAVERMAIAESHQPDLVEVRLASGRLNRALRAYDKAADDYRRVISLEPSNVVAWVGLARVHEATGARTDAADAYQRAIDIQPNYYLPHLEFGTFYYLLRSHERAEDHLLRAIAVAPANPSAYSNLGAVYVERGRYTQAEGILRRSLALEETRAVLANLGAALNYLAPFGGTLEVKGGGEPLKVKVEEGLFPFQCGVMTDAGNIGWPDDKDSPGAQLVVERR